MANDKKTYSETEEQTSMVAEPTAAYSVDVNALKLRGMEMLMSITDLSSLQAAVDGLSALCAKPIKNRRFRCHIQHGLSDEELAKELDGLPSWDEVEHTSSMDSLSKEDYIQVIKANRRKPMKGIEKWL